AVAKSRPTGNEDRSTRQQRCVGGGVASVHSRRHRPAIADRVIELGRGDVAAGILPPSDQDLTAGQERGRVAPPSHGHAGAWRPGVGGRVVDLSPCRAVPRVRGNPSSDQYLAGGQQGGRPEGPRHDHGAGGRPVVGGRVIQLGAGVQLGEAADREHFAIWQQRRGRSRVWLHHPGSLRPGATRSHHRTSSTGYGGDDKSREASKDGSAGGRHPFSERLPRQKAARWKLTSALPDRLKAACRDEGDGWVNWSGLATGVQEIGNQLALRLKRLLSSLANQEQRPATSPTAEETFLSVPSGV